MDQSDAPHPARGDLHVGDLTGHANHKGKIGEIKVIRRPIAGEYQSAGIPIHAGLVAIAMKGVGVTKTVDRLKQRP